MLELMLDTFMGAEADEACGAAYMTRGEVGGEVGVDAEPGEGGRGLLDSGARCGGGGGRAGALAGGTISYRTDVNPATNLAHIVQSSDVSYIAMTSVTFPTTGP